MTTRMMGLTAIVAACMAAPLAVHAADAPKSSSASSSESKSSAAENWQAQYAEERHESHGSIVLRGRRVEYTAIAGTIMIENMKNEPGALMSYVAYLRNGETPATRPITFLYNGGPGSSTVWLHMGAFGPKRVVAGNGVRGAPAPYPLVDNPNCPLDVTDLVFIDAPGTGFGRVGVDVQRLPPDEREKAAKQNDDLKKDFYGVDQDGRAFDIFITKFLTKFSRWNSPKYLFGESYGTTRSAVLAQDLASTSDIDLNGVMLLSQIFNFGLSVDNPENEPGNYLPYVLSLPTYAATAAYHKQLPNPPADLDSFLKTVEHFAITDYASALAQGDLLSGQDRHAIAEQMHEYIGLPAAYIEKANLRVDGGMFEHTLLASENETIGRLDTRYSGPSLDPLSKEAEYDPQSAALSSAYVSAYNEYARSVLGFPKDRKYLPEAQNMSRVWDWKHKQPGADQADGSLATNVMPDLAAAMKTNPRLKVMQFGGYYDLATPFYAAEYEMHQLGLPPSVQKNIVFAHFHTGHMVYVSPEALAKLHDDVVGFIESTSKGTGGGPGGR
ncbi:MAG: S10 family peptidase [Steroidobacteraceae bacterium]